MENDSIEADIGTALDRIANEEQTTQSPAQTQDHDFENKNLFTYERSIEFRPAMAESYKAWARVGMSAAMMMPPDSAIVFIGLMGEGIQIVNRNLSQTGEKQFYHIDKGGLEEFLSEIKDKKFLGYQILFQNFKTISNPEDVKTMLTAMRTENELEAVHYKHFIWVSQHIVNELALFDISKAGDYTKRVGYVLEGFHSMLKNEKPLQGEDSNRLAKSMKEVENGQLALKGIAEQIYSALSALEGYIAKQAEIQSYEETISSETQTRAMHELTYQDSHAELKRKVEKIVGELRYGTVGAEGISEYLGKAEAPPLTETEYSEFVKVLSLGMESVSHSVKNIGEIMHSLDGASHKHKETRGECLDHSNYLDDLSKTAAQYREQAARYESDIISMMQKLEKMCQSPILAKKLE